MGEDLHTPSLDHLLGRLAMGQEAMAHQLADSDAQRRAQHVENSTRGDRMEASLAATKHTVNNIAQVQATLAERLSAYADRLRDAECLGEANTKRIGAAEDVSAEIGKSVALLDQRMRLAAMLLGAAMTPLWATAAALLAKPLAAVVGWKLGGSP